MSLRDGDRLVRCELGHVHRGRIGAAGPLTRHLNPSIDLTSHQPGARP